jgi:hypothetical protein
MPGDAPADAAADAPKPVASPAPANNMACGAAPAGKVDPVKWTRDNAKPSRALPRS